MNARRASGGPCVLVVEDDALIALHLAAMLGDAGIDVSGPARGASDALALAAERPPAAALVDVRLGRGPDGVEVARALQADHGSAIVFVSGSGERATLDRIAAVPGAAFFHKPVDEAALVAHLRRLIGGRADPRHRGECG
jgi:DNA-binding response OmpR family regulator